VSLIDVDRIRAETPGVTHVTHLNAAGAALMPAPVIRALADHLDLEATVGGYEAADRAGERLEAMYGSLASLIGAAPDEIAFVENATRAWDMAFYALSFQAGDRILTARCEYASNRIAFLQVAQRTGAVVETIPDDASGATDAAALAGMLDERVKLVAISHVPTQGGLVNPAAAIGKVTRAAGIPYLLYACQSVGQFPVDVDAIGCDMLSATGRKFLRGPRGTGFLYVRRAWIERLDPPFLDLHAATWTGPDTYEVRSDARRFENWESFVAGRLGLGAAADYALALGPEAIWARTKSLATRLRAGLREIGGVTLRDLGTDPCAIVTFTVDGHTAGAVKAALAARAINVTISTVASARLDFTARNLTEVVRASPHYYNDEADVDRAVAAIRALSVG
jgi:selenocysteine lyase/cysteine desulfurase